MHVKTLAVYVQNAAVQHKPESKHMPAKALQIQYKNTSDQCILLL